MRFTVPQFLEVEDKIFGPITIRQFVILLVAGLFVFIAYKLADAGLFLFIAVVFGGFAALLAFYRPNGAPFHFFLLSILQTMRRPSRRIWRKAYSKGELQAFINENKKPDAVEKKVEGKKITHAKIRDLSLMVNTGGYYKGEK